MKMPIVTSWMVLIFATLLSTCLSLPAGVPSYLMYRDNPTIANLMKRSDFGKSVEHPVLSVATGTPSADRPIQTTTIHEEHKRDDVQNIHKKLESQNQTIDDDHEPTPENYGERLGLWGWVNDLIDYLAKKAVKGHLDCSHEHSEHHIINAPGYGYWQNGHWNLEVAGIVSDRCFVSDKGINRFANMVFLDAKIPEKGDNIYDNLLNDDLLSPTESVTARERFRDILMTKDLPPRDILIAPAARKVEALRLPGGADIKGHFDGAVEFRGQWNTSVLSGNATEDIQFTDLDIYPETLKDDSESHVQYTLVPPHGLTVVSDIDDTIRESAIWNPRQMLLNIFARPYKTWMNMHIIFDIWHAEVPGIHFHYTTVARDVIARSVINGTLQYYPPGSFDFPPLFVEDGGIYRRDSLRKTFQTFPGRKFIFLGDSGSKDIFSTYADLSREFPNQMQCLLLRNNFATTKEEYRIPPLEKLGAIPANKIYVFDTPDHLRTITPEHLNLVKAGRSTGCFPAKGDVDYVEGDYRPPNTLKVDKCGFSSYKKASVTVHGLWHMLKAGKYVKALAEFVGKEMIVDKLANL